MFIFQQALREVVEAREKRNFEEPTAACRKRLNFLFNFHNITSQYRIHTCSHACKISNVHSLLICASVAIFSGFVAYKEKRARALRMYRDSQDLGPERFRFLDKFLDSKRREERELLQNDQVPVIFNGHLTYCMFTSHLFCRV